ncbi:MAG: hypothetical protein GX443_00875 [Deltaproteobacteria bacterium]|nr:hypothetical protein [Deltaproteobacteria bacterium]
MKNLSTLYCAGRSVRWPSFAKILPYTILLVVVQSQWVSRIDQDSLRADLLLPLMFGVAVEWPPLPSVGWALVWGYALDALSGKFWGFHVVSYLLAVCLVHMASEKLEVESPLYQMTFVGMCALAQSFVLGAFLFFESSGAFGTLINWVHLLFRAVFTTVVAPLVIYPVCSRDRAP